VIREREVSTRERVLPRSHAEADLFHWAVIEDGRAEVRFAPELSAERGLLVVRNADQAAALETLGRHLREALADAQALRVIRSPVGTRPSVAEGKP
jgi:hypothetical protein